MDKQKYQELIGSLNYLVTGTRVDLGFAVSFLSRFSAAPTKKSWLLAKRVLRYLNGTKHLGLKYRSKPENSYEFYSDADFSSDTLTRRSCTGQLILAQGTPIFWSSSRQSCVSLSSTEAELIAATETCKSALWTTRLLNELGIIQVPCIRIDNLSTIRLIQDGTIFHKRTKHICNKQFFVREQVELGNINVSFTPSASQMADVLTKALNSVTFQNLREKLLTTDQ